MLFYFACEAAGASAPGIPHALLMERRKDQRTTRTHSRRENADVCVALDVCPLMSSLRAQRSNPAFCLTSRWIASLRSHAQTLCVCSSNDVETVCRDATHHPSSPRTRGPITA